MPLHAALLRGVLGQHARFRSGAVRRSVPHLPRAVGARNVARPPAPAFGEV